MTLGEAEKLPLVARMPLKRHGVSFYQCCLKAIEIPELVANFDRLSGTNLSLKGSGLDLAIDEATGRMDADIEQFIEFCWECIFTRFGNVA